MANLFYYNTKKGDCMNILWDFDGTLFDTYPAYTKVLHTVLGDEYDKNEIYKKLKVSYSHAMEHYQVSNEKQDEMTALRIDLHPSEMKPFDHVEEILKYADKNVIMTHKDRAGVSAILKHYGWENYFEDIVTIDDGFARNRILNPIFTCMRSIESTWPLETAN